jgi:hypothetical protein
MLIHFSAAVKTALQSRLDAHRIEQDFLADHSAEFSL